jgi:hypothetical protein
LQQCFKVKDLGPVKKWLGMEVKRSKWNHCLNQDN